MRDDESRYVSFGFLMKIFFLAVLGLSLISISIAYEFYRSIKEIQVLSDRVGMNVGVTYGTCGENEGWWGWDISNPASNYWPPLLTHYIVKECLVN